MKQYLYHRVPEKMIGTTIFPLNALKNIDEETYTEARSKYDNRPHLLVRAVPPLNCTWNDVVFMLAVHPQEIIDAQIKAGLKDWHYQYFKIDVDSLDQSLLCTFCAELEKKSSETNFDVFDRTMFESYATLPSAVHTHYQRVKNGPRPIFYFPASLVPHILYKGTIDVSNTEIVTI